METKTCSVTGCGNGGRIRRGMCSACWQWCQAHPDGDPAARKRVNPGPVDGLCTVVEDGAVCRRKHVSKGMCNMHWLRTRYNGAPDITRTRPKGTLMRDLLDAATQNTNECTFLSGYSGRPYVRPPGGRNGTSTTGSRAAWILVYGDPGDAYVLHTCNGGSGEHGCVNIRHLYLGDAEQNAQDMYDAGRQVHNPPKGADVRNSVLTEVDVRSIRSRWSGGGVTQKLLAEEYRVSRATICNVIKRKSWAHI